MLALRSVLAIPPSSASAAEQGSRSAADAVMFDLGALRGLDRDTALQTVARAVTVTGRSGRATLVRLSSAASGRVDADLGAACGRYLGAVVLPAVEVPQDARDADVLLRKHELAGKLAPGVIRLIPEIDSAAGLEALPRILDAVDRVEAVALNLIALSAHFGLGSGDRALGEQSMALLSVACRARNLPWFLGSGDAAAAAAARDLGAHGAVIDSEPRVRGMNSLFTPDARHLAAAREVVQSWEAVSGDGEASGAPTVDRRAWRAARFELDRADAVARRGAIE